MVSRMLTQTNETPRLATPRLVLRGVEPTDAHALHRVFGDPAVMAHYVDLTPGETAWTRPQTDAWVAERAAEWRDLGIGYWAVTIAGEVVGMCGLHPLSYLPVIEPDTELSYRLRHDYWGQGIIPEACSAALDWAFRETDLTSVMAGIITENMASQRVAQKLGMRRERTLAYTSPISGRSAHFDVYRLRRAP